MLLGEYFMVSVIFPAAGQGKRMQAGLNKVFLEIAGKPILVHTLLKFSKVPEIGELIVVVGSDEVAVIEQMLKDVAGLKPYMRMIIWRNATAINADFTVFKRFKLLFRPRHCIIYFQHN